MTEWNPSEPPPPLSEKQEADIFALVDAMPPYSHPDHFPYRQRHPELIGASEVPAIVGESPFESPTEWYLRRTSRLPERARTQDALSKMQVGSLLEEGLLKIAEQRIPGLQVDTYMPDKIGHPEIPGYGASADAISADHLPIECKFTSSWWEPPPAYVLVQIWAQMDCLDVDKAWLIQARPSESQLVELRGRLLEKTDIAPGHTGAKWRDRIKMMSRALIHQPLNEAWFPPWSHSPADKKPFVDWRFEKDEKLEQLAAKYADLSDTIKALGDRKADVRARLLHAMGTREVVLGEDHKIVQRHYLSTRVNIPALRKDPDLPAGLLERHTGQSSSVRLTVKEHEE